MVKILKYLVGLMDKILKTLNKFLKFQQKKILKKKSIRPKQYKRFSSIRPKQIRPQISSDFSGLCATFSDFPIKFHPQNLKQKFRARSCGAPNYFEEKTTLMCNLNAVTVGTVRKLWCVKRCFEFYKMAMRKSGGNFKMVIVSFLDLNSF